MQKYLPILLAHFVVLQYKFHSIHTSSAGMCFLPFHEFMNEVYQFFWDDNIDRIKERALILGFDTPSSITTLLQMCKMEELESVPEIEEAKWIVLQDLQMMEKILQTGIEMSGQENDLVTQNTLIDYNDTVGKMRWKIQMMK